MRVNLVFVRILKMNDAFSCNMCWKTTTKIQILKFKFLLYLFIFFRSHEINDYINVWETLDN